MIVASLGDRFSMSFLQESRGSFETSGPPHSVTQCYVPEDQNPLLFVCFQSFARNSVVFFGLCILVTPVATHHVVFVSQLLRLLVATVATSGG